MKIAKWYNNFQSPSVLMIDDLSDAYIDVYKKSYKNDWGYMCNSEGSSFDFLEKNLLNDYKYIKITFFVPYLKHNVINENSQFNYKKFALGDRPEYITFIKTLVGKGHEIAHHGSNHGEYIDLNTPTTVNNWTHEWKLFDDINKGVEVTLNGVKKFKEYCNIDVVGGKYCGYDYRENSREIIDKCNFLYWCERASFNEFKHKNVQFGNNEVISFPTNFAGNSFVRLSYMTGNPTKDKKKKLLKYFQPLYNLFSYFKIYRLYKNANIISVQEHMSPSTTSNIVQSANVISDISSLNKIYTFLSNFSIWYANCNEVAKYIYLREHANIILENNTIKIFFDNKKNLKNTIISIIGDFSFRLYKDKNEYISIENNGLYVVNLPVYDGKNIFYTNENEL